MDKIKISFDGISNTEVKAENGYPTPECKEQISYFGFGEGGARVYFDTSDSTGVAILGRNARKFSVVS